jgi:hypothetical protein
MYEMGKAAQIAAEMKNYNLTILGISEARWTCTVGTNKTRQRRDAAVFRA